jgi:PAS domain S-box-containing protein
MSYPLRVLIVEDAESDALLAVRALGRAGFAPEFERVESREGMRAALEGKTWDVILCDHNMPGFNEIEALRVLSELGLNLPFIVLSRSIREEEVVSAMKAGAHEFVNKRDLHNIGVAIERAVREVATQQGQLRAQEALRVSEERYALALRGSRDGVWDWNILTSETYYSPRFKELLGFDEDELCCTVSSLLEDIVHEGDRGAVRGAMNEHLRRRTPFDVEARFKTKQGEHRWYSIRGQALWGSDGAPTRMAGSLSDITDRKAAEERLREKLEIIERQQDAIRTLSTPIIEVWEGTLTMPVFGTIDAVRAEQMMTVLLSAIVRTRCRFAILDMTGVQTVDARTADHVVRLIRAVQLIGSQGIVVGIRPEVAQTMASIGVDLSHIRTLANLRQALVMCMRGTP